MENFDDEFGDLSGYKILSFEEVTRGFEGNKNPLKGIVNKSFEEISNQYALQSPLGQNSIFYKKTINKIIYQTVGMIPIWKYRIENSTKGTELIANYTKYDKTIDSSKGKYDEETDFIIYIEEQTNKTEFYVDLNTVCLIKMSQAMLNEYFAIIKADPKSNVLEKWSSIIIAQQKIANNIIFTQQKLVEAFTLEIAYRPLKKIVIGDEKYTKNETVSGILDGISDAFRKLKFEKESWDPTLASDIYLWKYPIKAIDFLKEKITVSVNLLQKTENFLYVLEYLSIEKVFLKSIRLFISLFKANLQVIAQLLDSLKSYSPYHFSFLCGIWDGIVEFIAGFVDILLLTLSLYFQLEDLNAEDKIVYLKLKEGIEECIEKYMQEPEFLQKATERAIANYFEERYSENQNGYVISHNAGEDLVIAVDIIFSIVEVVKSIADAGKILPKMESWIDNAIERNPNLKRKLEEALEPKKIQEVPIREKSIEEVIVKPEKKPTPKERAETKRREINRKLEEQKVLRTKTIDGNPPPTYEKGFDYYEARTPKPSEIPLRLRRQAKLLTHKVDKEVALLLDVEHSSGFSEGKKILQTKKGKKFIDSKWLKDRQLVAGMIHQDKKLGEIIMIKTNYPKRELNDFIKMKGIGRGESNLSEIKEIYKFYKQQGYLEYDMHPYIESLLKTHFEEVAKGIKHPPSYEWERTGGLPGTHAEVLALNDLLWILESKGVKIDDEVLRGFLGYNKNLLSEEYMIRCGDCQLILKDIIFLEKVIKFK